MSLTLNCPVTSRSNSPVPSVVPALPCSLRWHKLDESGLAFEVLKLFAELVATDGIAPEIAYCEFMKIDEFRSIALPWGIGTYGDPDGWFEGVEL